MLLANSFFVIKYFKLTFRESTRIFTIGRFSTWAEPSWRLRAGPLRCSLVLQWSQWWRSTSTIRFVYSLISRNVLKLGVKLSEFHLNFSYLLIFTLYNRTFIIFPNSRSLKDSWSRLRFAQSCWSPSTCWLSWSPLASCRTWRPWPTSISRLKKPSSNLRTWQWASSSSWRGDFRLY